MKENAAILNQLMTATRNMLEQHRKVFEESLDILIAEEVLSGNQFRELLQRSINQQIA